MLEPANQNLAGRIPPGSDPWDEDDGSRAVKGIALGVAIMAVLVVAAVAAAIWL